MRGLPGVVALLTLVCSAEPTPAEPLLPGPVPTLRLRIASDDEQRLRDEPRRYVTCRLGEDGGDALDDVAVKLKGAAGSFRDYDDRPGLTLHVARHAHGRRLHGLERFHLNNAVQDDTFANEWLFATLAADAGLPAPRVAHARVWINDRDLGLYVLREGFDTPFLERHFGSAAGTLYDGGFCQDIDGELEKDSGAGPDDRSDLAALVAACRTDAPEQRHAAIGAALDVDRFLTFMALELMTGHWDGYTTNVNNYRLFFPPEGAPAIFLPHGADQLFAEPTAPILDPPHGLVAVAVMADPAWRADWRDRVRDLLPLFDPPEPLVGRVDALRARLAPVLAAIDPALATAHGERCAELAERLRARAQFLREQAEAPEPVPVAFDERGMLRPTGWQPGTLADGVSVAMHDTGTGPRLEIRATPGSHCTASWRCRLRLPRGTYRLRMPASTRAVEAIDDEKGRGAGVRVSGASRDQGLEGTSRAVVEHTFVVEDESADVELVAELRATAGSVTFDATACDLARIGDTVADEHSPETATPP
jgi:spore coat protein H